MRSLNVKLILAFLVVSLLGTTLVAAYVWYMTTDEFGRYVVAQNRVSILDRLAEAYSEEGSWEEVAIRARINPFGPLPERPGADRWHPPHEAIPFRPSPIVVADADRRVVVSGRGYSYGDVVSREEYRLGMPIQVDGEEVGRLLLGYQPSSMNRPFERFFRRFYLALGFGTLGGTGIALLLGILLARSLSSPLRELTRATQAMSRGDLEQRIPVRSDDELGELARSFNQLSADLVQAEDLRRQMTADIAHELRTPLSLILGHAEGLADGVLPPSSATFDIIYDEARRLTRLVDDLRTLSLSDAGELSLERKAISPGVLLEDAVVAHRSEADRAGIILRIVLKEKLPSVDVDPDRIGQVLHNLLTNALRYTPEGGEIVLSAQVDGEYMVLAVADTGPGISVEELPHVFERFYRADKSRQRREGGSGLGLAIARSIVEDHGGRIWAESERGQGTVVRLALPIADGA